MPRAPSPNILPDNRDHLITYGVQPPQQVYWDFCSFGDVPLAVGIDDDGAVCRISFMPSAKSKKLPEVWLTAWPETVYIHHPQAIAALTRHVFSGKPCAIRMTGTPFQQSVWKQIAKIPSGEILSYADIARRVKKPLASRAVGTACGANPVPLLVPCHRVLASNGGLGGFGGGLPLKKKLLAQELGAPEKIRKAA